MTDRELFMAASQIADLTARAAFLDRACAADKPLRDRVESLFREHEKIESDSETAAASSGEPEVTRTASDVIPTARENVPGKSEFVGAILAGKYKLLQEIGAGGMGQVFKAQQTEPVKRSVAVKLIKVGMDSKQVLARFEAERQALAMMDHPHIAKILDGGLYEGRPFFVMELVQGTPITEFCDTRKLTPHQRLELFVPVCNAIQHAHQKGIIHRDIKPTNVLVALSDGKPVVKVIDFGVAKATAATLTEMTIDTGFGSIVGTPQYMSPEQATFLNVDIDTRSDVYSLGILLYELLAGSPPFTGKELQKRGFLEVLRVVREEEPPRPSTKLNHSEAKPSISANRNIEPAKLAGLLKGELDWIVMRALEKDRTRRYETANGFAADINRYLAGEAVLAHPPSTAYRVKKFVRRHKTHVIAAGLVLFALLAGIITTAWQAVRADLARVAEKEQREEAETNERKAVAAAEKERQATELTVARLKQIEAINATVIDIFTEFDIRKVKEGNEPVEYVLAQKLIEAGKKLDAKAIHDPLVLANMQNRLGYTLMTLGQPQAAIVLLIAAHESRRARLGPNHLETLVSLGNLATAYHYAGKLDLALPLLEEALQRTQAELGPKHIDTLAAANNLALGYKSAGKLTLALPLLERTLAIRKDTLGLDDPATLVSLGNLAEGYRDNGRLDLAIPLLEETLQRTKTKLGPDHADTLVSMSNLAVGYNDVGQRDLALPLLVETVTRKKAKFGPDHPSTLKSLNNLAVCYQDDGKLELALPLYEETYKVMKAKHGPDHSSTLFSMSNVALGYHAAGKLDVALPLFEQVLALRKVKLGPDHPHTLDSINNLGRAYRDAKQGTKAAPLFQEFVAGQRKRIPRDDPRFTGVLAQAGLDLLKCQQFVAAEEMLRECLTIRERTQPDNWTTFNTQSMLGESMLGQKKYADAEPILLAGYEGLKQREKAIPPHGNTRIPEAINRLIELYSATNKPDGVKKWQAERAKYPDLTPKSGAKK